MLEIGRIVRTKGGPSKERLQQGYKKLLSIVGSVVWQAKRFSREVAAGTKRADEAKQQTALEALQKQPDTFGKRQDPGSGEPDLHRLRCVF